MLARREPWAKALTRKHLGEQMSIDAVEHTEWVDSGLANDLSRPFGHLYPRWQALRVQIGAGDAVHPFEITPRLTDRMPGIVRGYALVRSQRIVDAIPCEFVETQ